MAMIRGDAARLPLADGVVDCVVTSPPYLNQRVYGNDHGRELGRETTVAEFATLLADVLDECRRVMRPNTSTLWLNLGDKANNSGGAGGDWSKAAANGNKVAAGGPGRFLDPAFPQGTFLDVPGHVLRELFARGWRLRMPIVWDKGREAPESLRYIRRPRWSHEMLFMLNPWPRPRTRGAPRPKFYPSALAETGSVWHFPPGSSGEKHLAPFPDELARRCILATTLPGDLVLDPFAGSNTVARVAEQCGRIGLGVDIYAGRPDLVHGGR